MEIPLEQAKNVMSLEQQKYIEVFTDGNTKSVKFQIQSQPISIVGINGVQACDMIVYIYNLINILNNEFPCEENKRTLQALMDAWGWQEQRRINRMNRGVEGKNEA